MNFAKNSALLLVLVLFIVACNSSAPRESAAPTPAPAVVDPITAEFLGGLEGATPIFELSPEEARDVLRSVQSGPIAAPQVAIESRVLPVGPTGKTRIRIYRPAGVEGVLPGILYFHGAGWVMGDPETHDRLVRELAVGARAVLVFVDYDRSPEARFPIAIEQDYAVLRYVADHSADFGIDADHLAIAGDSVGGNMTAVVSLMAKERGGPRIAAQLLFYPVTDAGLDSPSYERFASGPWLTHEAMVWFWNQYLPEGADRDQVLVSPLNASIEQLRGLPRALVITAENDVLRDEGEAYARKLEQAGVPVTATRYLNAIHDFVMLNALAETPATRAAMAQAIGFLRDSLHGN